MPKRKDTQRSAPATRTSSTQSRNQSLDTLRGIAILLMVVDHIAGILLDVKIEPTTIRFLTRLSMPLFCILMGYFLQSQERMNWRRFSQLAAATVAMNLVFFTLYGKVEILASLLVCYCLFAVLRGAFVFLFVAAFFFQWDPSAIYFDFPLPLVATCVAQGVILKRYGLPIAAVTSALSLLAIMLVTPPSVYALYFVLPATLLVGWAVARPQFQVPWLTTLGRYPLTAYLIQYFAILTIEGMLWGVAVGDALGHSTEFRYDPTSRHDKFGTILDHLSSGDRQAGSVSDDPQMTVWAAESLLEQGCFEFNHMARKFVQRREWVVASTPTTLCFASSDDCGANRYRYSIALATRSKKDAATVP